MCRLNERRWLTAIAVFAALVAGSCASLAQAPGQAFLAGAVQPQPRTVGPGFQPTPEDVGDALMLHQRYQAAIESYKQAPQDSPDAWNKMGIAYQMMYNFAEATRCYKASLKLNPRNVHALNNLGTVYDSLKDLGSAERMYRKALKLNAGSAIANRNLGTNLLAQHKYKEGWEKYQAALAIDPHVFENGATPQADNPEPAQERGAMNYYMARGCVRAGQNDRAIDYLRRALNEGFTNPRKIVADSEFAGLRGSPAFEQLLGAQGAR